MSDLICPYLNAVCIKGQCVAWIKKVDVDENNKPTGTHTKYCMIFNI